MIDQAFRDYSVAKLRQYLGRIEVCLSQLADEEIWSREHTSNNSIGNLCLHLNGNVRQWIVSGLGGEPDRRDRDAEFATTGPVGREELVDRLSHTVEQACDVIEQLTPSRLEENVIIQQYPVTVLQAVYHVVEHFSHHTGQILFATKSIKGEDLGFHRHLNQNIEHHEPTP